MHAEAERLVHAGLLTDRRLGRSRLLQANTSARITRPLTELLMATYGPQLVVADEFADVPGAKQVVLYGSWARRYRGELGTRGRRCDGDRGTGPRRGVRRRGAGRGAAAHARQYDRAVGGAWQEGTDALVIAAKQDALVVLDGSGEAT